jgi:hypothetical protein
MVCAAASSAARVSASSSARRLQSLPLRRERGEGAARVGLEVEDAAAAEVGGVGQRECAREREAQRQLASDEGRADGHGLVLLFF